MHNSLGVLETPLRSLDMPGEADRWVRPVTGCRLQQSENGSRPFTLCFTAPEGHTAGTCARSGETPLGEAGARGVRSEWGPRTPGPLLPDMWPLARTAKRLRESRPVEPIVSGGEALTIKKFLNSFLKL